ncbi:hypothetical protein AAEU29_17825 [Pseudoalteromonas sp. SSM20]|uniref:hypothetical protein n=1 Tax=Pseudoalteromonas sp. SSM20 TaxID=3139394 RepID=UPI003BA87FD8
MKSAPKQLLIVGATFIAFSALVLNVMVSEYSGWTEKLACYDKCKTLGFEQCIFKKNNDNALPNRCNALKNKDIIVLVLN